MRKIINISIVIACATIIGCQGPGTTQEQVAELRKEIQAMEVYLESLKVYLDSVRTIQNRLFKTSYRSNPREMARMFPSPAIDTFPNPKPPPPPGQNR